MRRVYLDHNATTRLRPEARRAMEPFLDEEYGNPSSIHAAGRAARQAVELARDEVGRLLGAVSEEVIFTSGGTEAVHLGLRGAARAARAADQGRRRVLVGAVEHPAVAGAAEALVAEGFEVEVLPVSSDGRVQLSSLARLDSTVALVSVQAANHELGVLQPISELAAAAHRAGAWMHCDAVQIAGKHDFAFASLGVDVAAVSAHKLGGPKGVGAVLVARGRVLTPLWPGGHQERDRRPGTENVAGIVGFGVAARLARESLSAESVRLSTLRERLERGLMELGGVVRSQLAPRVSNTVNVAFADCEGDLMVESLDLVGICVSTGAACTSGSRAPSPVLLALGASATEAKQAIRFSLGRDSDEEAVQYVLGQLPKILSRVRGA